MFVYLAVAFFDYVQYREAMLAAGTIIITDLPPSPVGTVFNLGIMDLSAIYGVFDTIRLVMIIAAILILIEYIVSFCYVAYLYDNKDWEIVRILNEAPWRFEQLLSRLLAPSEKTLQDREVSDKQLLVAVLAIRNPEKIYTNKTVPGTLQKESDETDPTK